jgi:SpoVK/Ycf46/Vps4 family AAA+-type ATPase
VDFWRADERNSNEGFQAHSLLLSGPPGCGKDTAASWLAEQLKLPVIVYKSFAAFSWSDEIGAQITAAFRFAVDNQCVFVVEDLDEIAPQDSGDNPLKYARNSQGKYRLVESVQDWYHSEHRSLLIATTTARDRIDEAVRRRFRLQIDMESTRSAAET